MTHWLEQISPTVRLAGHGGHGGDWVEPLRVIYDHELVVFTRGGCVVEIGQEQYGCKAGSFIIIPPGVEHVSRSMEGAGRRHWVHFDWSYVPGGGDGPVFTYLPGRIEAEHFRYGPGVVPSQVFNGEVSHVAAVMGKLGAIEKALEDNAAWVQMSARALLLELLIMLLGESGAEPMVSGASRGGDDLGYQIRRYLERVAYEKRLQDYSLQQMMEADMGMSYAHQARVFKRQFGISPLTFINAIRITRAKSLLRDSHLSLSAIAGEVGFSSLNYFSRLFYQHTGQRPGEFRRQG